MIWRSREPRYDVASGISQGARDYQEDAITSDFPVGAEAGFVVLADGMGGHSAGDVASMIVLTEVYSELKFHFADVQAFEERASEILRSVAELANETLRQFTKAHPDLIGMGATLVAPCLVENRLWWVSIGDSPLYLYRNGKLSQLNEDHSMAPQIDSLVRSGQIDARAAAEHPDRNSLLSVLMGTQISKIDCPEAPLELKAGDIVLCSSDGLQSLPKAQIERVISKYRKTRSTEIAERMLDELGRLGDPDQDNISFAVIKVNDASVRPKEERSDVATVTRPKRMTSFAPSPMVVPSPLSADAAKDESARGDLDKKPARKVVVIPPPHDSEGDQNAPPRLRPRRVVVIK